MDIDGVFRFFGIGGSGVAYEKLDASAYLRFILVVKFDAFQFLMRCDGDANDFQREGFILRRVVREYRGTNHRQTADRGQQPDIGRDQTFRAGLPVKRDGQDIHHKWVLTKLFCL